MSNNLQDLELTGVSTETAIVLNDVRAIERSHRAQYNGGAFPTGKVSVSLAGVGSPEYKRWLQAKRESKAKWWASR